MSEHNIEYKLEIVFNQDGIKIESTGEKIKYWPIVEGAELRHRHTKLINMINDIIRQYIKDNR